MKRNSFRSPILRNPAPRIRQFFPVALAILAFGSSAWAETIDLLNVSYDPTRELYAEYNKAFVQYWKGKTQNRAVARRLGASRPARFSTDWKQMW